MAYAFKDCCDSSNYFYLNGIPGSVSVGETYYVLTTNGDEFCATYVELPGIATTVPTYTLDEMTEYANCSECQNILPCPEVTLLDFSSIVGAGVTNVTVNECVMKTLFPMYVDCVTTEPTIPVRTDGIVTLFVSGGTPPYSFYSANTITQLGNGASPSNGVYTIFPNATSGTYNINVIDYYQDYQTLVECIVPEIPTFLSVNCMSGITSIYGNNDGEINLKITGGTTPYQYIYNGNQIVLPLTGLTAGTYTLTVNDSGTGNYFQTSTVNCIVQDTPPIDYPSQLCLSFLYCENRYYLNFLSSSTQNFKPVYTLQNTTEIGVTGMTMSYGTTGWETTSSSSNNLQGVCGTSGGVKFIKTSKTTTQPIGGWGGTGLVNQSSEVLVTSGTCNEVIPTFSYTQKDFCSSSTCDGTITIRNESSVAGGPYDYFFDGTQVESPVIRNVCSGTHYLQIRDSAGNLSNIVSMVMNELPSAIITKNSATNNPGYGTTNSFRNHQFLLRLPNIPSSVTVQGKLKITVVRTRLWGSNYNSGTFSPATNFILNGVRKISAPNVSYIDGILPLGSSITSNDNVTMSLISNNTVTANNNSCGGSGDITTTVYESGLVGVISNNSFSASTSTVMNWTNLTIPNNSCAKMKTEIKVQFSTVQDDGACVTVDSTVYESLDAVFEQSYGKPNPTVITDIPNSYFPGLGPEVQSDPGGPPVNG